MFSVNFTVFGNPVAKGRPKFARRGNFVATYTPDKTRKYEEEVRKVATTAMKGQEPLETPLNVYIYIRLPIPQSYSKKRTEACLEGLERPTKKPDLDNYAKAIMDSLNGIVYADDSQVVELHVTKVYATTPAVEIAVSENLL